MGAMGEIQVQLIEAERNAELVRSMVEKARAAERIDTLHGLARYLNCKGMHEAAEMLRMDPLVFRFMRAESREA